MAFFQLFSLWSVNTNQAQRFQYALMQHRNRMNKNDDELFVQWHQTQMQIRSATVARSLRMQHREIWIFPKSGIWWNQIATKEWGDSKWKENFRMSKTTFDMIVLKLRPVLQKRRTRFRESVPVQKRVAVALWRLATGDEFRTIAELFGVGISTAQEICDEFVHAVNLILKPIVCVHSKYFF